LIKRRGHVDKTSVFSAIDLVPTLLDLTGTNPPPGVDYDGEVLTNTLLGDGGSRQQPILFRRPPDRDSFYGDADLPDLAIRDGKWKLLCEYDGSDVELYDLSRDRGETVNLASKHAEIANDLKNQLLRWHESMPPDNGADYKRPRRR